jgi:uncharacterized protein YraI
MRRVSSIILMLVFLSLSGLYGVTAQSGGDDACPALVETALQMVADSCTDLDRDEACYGHSRVDATFWDEQADLTFSQPSDRVALIDLQSITTHPLDVEAETWGIAALHVQADVPDTLPGQAVTFLLMGDATLENAVPPEDAAQPVEPVAATASMGANLRSRPSTNANVVSSVPAGAGLSLIGVNTAGDWYQVALEDGGTAWVWADLIVAEDNDALAALPIRDATAPAYGPMQAVYFSTGLGDPACAEAPNALVVHSPEGTEVTLQINDLDVTLGSTVLLTIVEIETDEGPVTVMLLVLLQGHLETVINDRLVVLDDSPDALPVLAVTLNDENRVDENSRVIGPPLETITPTIENACLNAITTGILTGISIDVCSAEPAVLAAEDTDVPPSPAPLANVGPNDVCTAAPFGPGTNYPQQGMLTPGQTLIPDGYADGADGFRWWRLSDGTWIRDDLVGTAGACEVVPLVGTPPAPEPATPPPQPPAQPGQSVWIQLDNVHVCEPFTFPVNSVVTFNIGFGRNTPEELAATRDSNPTTISINGQPLTTYMTDIIPWTVTPWSYWVQAQWQPTVPGTYVAVGDSGSEHGVIVCNLTVTE